MGKYSKNPLNQNNEGPQLVKKIIIREFWRACINQSSNKKFSPKVITKNRKIKGLQVNQKETALNLNRNQFFIVQ